MSLPSFHNLQISQVSRETDDAVSVTFAVPSELAPLFHFHAGQYLTVRRPGDAEDQRRSYSLCSAPCEGFLRIGVREIRGGALSPWLNRDVQVGTAVEVMPPDGQFGLLPETGTGRHLLLIAVGSGITPLLSIARQALAEDSRNRVSLLYGNRNLASMMFREDLEDLKNRFLGRFALHCTFSREPQEIPLHHGRLDGTKLREFLARLVPPESVDEVLLCGPHAVLEECCAVLREAGVAADRLHVERFGAPVVDGGPTAEIATPEGARVVVILDGVQRELTLADPSLSILDAARGAGMDLPFSCRTGVCATCRARVMEGEVKMSRNFALLASDLKAGIVLTCQAHPVSERVVISFDAR
jgi:ring-1,2-phenylacetyl-CoA epoxidase subunit PaaE